MVTINGVLATVASSVGDDLLALGRATEQDGVESPAGLGASPSPATSCCSTTPSPSTRWWSTSRPARVIDDPIVVVHVVSGGGGEAVFPRTVVRAGATSTAGVVEIVVDVDAGLLADLPSRTGTVLRTAGPAARSTSWCR